MADNQNEQLLKERNTQSLIELLKKPNFSKVIENTYVLDMISKMCDKCPICLDPLNNNNLSISKCDNPANSNSSHKPCGALFHSDCLNKHFLSDNRCPYCRFTHITVKKPEPEKFRDRPERLRPRGQQNPYIAFCCDKRYKIQEEYPNLNPSEILYKLTETWRNLSVIEKNFYVLKAREHNRNIMINI